MPNLPKVCKAIGNKWVLKAKHIVDGIIEKYKVRPIAKGAQQKGINYEETFSLVVRFASSLWILVIIASIDFELHQINVKTRFLNGDMEEKIYMQQSISFIKEG